MKERPTCREMNVCGQVSSRQVLHSSILCGFRGQSHSAECCPRLAGDISILGTTCHRSQNIDGLGRSRQFQQLQGAKSAQLIAICDRVAQTGQQFLGAGPLLKTWLGFQLCP